MSGLEELLTGRTLVKRYHIQEVIGRGGFAAVYRADDERLGRPVAVKVITVTALDAAGVARHRDGFEHEARAAASLPQHPNVVTVHDFGVDPVLGLDFLVMEFLHGEDLATLLRRVPKPPLNDALRILRDAATGVAVGHGAGIVHRDVKPGNIFLAQSHAAEAPRVCVLDFGIARLVADDRTLTGYPGEGTPLSPAYASPEQSRGVHDLTPASDVFSLGVVAYQLLTGEKPFTGPRGIDPANWIPARSIRDLDPDVPEAIAAIVQRALAYDPVDRFADAGAMATALAATGAADSRAAPAAADMPAPLAPPQSLADETLYHAPSEGSPAAERQRIGFSQTAAAPKRRSRALPALLGLLILAGAAAGWWFLGQTPDPVPPDASAEADLETIVEGLEAENGGGVGPDERGTDSPGSSPVAPPLPAGESSLPESQPGALPESVPTSEPDSGTPTPATIGEAAADTASEATNAVPPPPRIIGVPVDSAGGVRSPTSAADPAPAPPPRTGP